MALRDWFRRSTARRISDVLWQTALARHDFLAGLAPAETARLRELCEQFLASKEFTAAPGFVIDDDICLSIAVQGCLPILHLGLSAYADWVGIVVYPDEFVVDRQVEDEHGIIHEYVDTLAGEAWEGGPLLVSWHDVELRGDGYNVVIHEFAHKLDLLNGEADGVPPLHSGIDEGDWRDTLHAAYHDFCTAVDRGEETWLDPYASEDPAEFFAVISEAFFEIPDAVATTYPAFYALLCRYYRQDPAARLTGRT